MSVTFDYAISLVMLQPPRSVDHHYAARVTTLIRISDLLAEDLDPASFGITEVWGRTPDEARHKLERRLDHWMAQQAAEAQGVCLSQEACLCEVA